MHEFFVVAPPELIPQLEAELREFEGFLLGSDGRPDPKGFGNLKLEHGGITLKCDPLIALQIHFFSKIASRVLLRMTRFRATEFPRLEKSLKSIDLKKWIGDSKFRLKIDAQKSKLNNEKRIMETAKRVWAIDENAEQTVLIRVDHDEFTVSLDLSGEHLHRRQTGRDLGGPAPIRETLASGLVRFLIQGEGLSVLQNVTLIDPMAGSGTLLSEASGIYRLTQGRSFAFQSQPWIPKLLKSASFAANYRNQPKKIWKRLVALDQAPQARERLSELKTQLADSFEVADSIKSLQIEAPIWVIANPPYGERLSAIKPEELRDLLLVSNPDRVAVVLPVKLVATLKKTWPRDWRILEQEVSNGGIPCLYTLFMKKF